MTNNMPVAPAKDVAPAPVRERVPFAVRMTGRLLTTFAVVTYEGGGLAIECQTDSGKSAPWVAVASLNDNELAALAAALGL